MLDQSEFCKQRALVEGNDFGSLLAGTGGKHDGHQAAYDVGIGIALEMQDRISRIQPIDGVGQPDLAYAALHLGEIVLVGIGHRLERAAQFAAPLQLSVATYTPAPVGDLNCDGAIDNFDIDPFVLALTSAGENPPFASYNAAYPDCDPLLADINGDGVVNNFDIDPFVELLTNG